MTEQCRNCKEMFTPDIMWSYYACQCFCEIKCMNCKIFNHFCDERICTACIVKAFSLE